MLISDLAVDSRDLVLQMLPTWTGFSKLCIFRAIQNGIRKMGKENQHKLKRILIRTGKTVLFQLYQLSMMSLKSWQAHSTHSTWNKLMSKALN